MCVQTQHQSWERPASPNDFSVLNESFPGIDYAKLYDAMRIDDAVPLACDLVLVGAMYHATPDDIGVRLVRFSGSDPQTDTVVKLKVMEGIVPWFENSALGTDMWRNADSYLSTLGVHVHFAMKCSCGLVPVATKHNGMWNAWKRRFNQDRAHIYGRTNIRWQVGIEGTDFTPADVILWERIRRTLNALPA
jgi:hypothetical protein